MTPQCTPDDTTPNEGLPPPQPPLPGPSGRAVAFDVRLIPKSEAENVIFSEEKKVSVPSSKSPT